jgi:cell division protein FtsI/penicillin-binding protein 2
MDSSVNTLDYTRRYWLAGMAFAVVAIVIVVQIVRIQVGPVAAALREQGGTYDKLLHTFYPERGVIYDRWGHLMAGNETVYEVGIDLRTQGKNPETIAYVLSKVLASGHPEYDSQSYYDDVFTIASSLPTTTTVYRVVADFVTQKEVDEIRQWGQQFDLLYRNRKEKDRPTLKGLAFQAHYQRTYPEKSLASNIIGFVSREGLGYFGVEAAYNPVLAGEPKSIWMAVNPNDVTEMPDIPDGASLILTIDRDIQAMVEQTLDEALIQTGAVGGTILVTDPRTGEILAMASTPRMDLNQYWEASNLFPGRTPFNRAVSTDYEPGSVFKVLTMAAALDAGAVTPATTFYDTGSIEIGGYWIHNWNYGAWGEQTMQGCLQHSLNVCLTWVAMQLGNDKFYDYMQKFGIGHRTGVDLAEEVPGRLKIPGDEDWYEVELGTNSFGQGVAVTPIQMVTAIGAVANGGKMMQPHVLLAYVDRGAQYDMPTNVLGTPISENTAKTLSEMLAASLEEEASSALVPGYRVAGKTGTASISTPEGYDPNLTNASFVGWGPVDDPKFMVYIWLERPSTSEWGSVVAAPVFQTVFERLVVMTNLPPDDIRKQVVNGQ